MAKKIRVKRTRRSDPDPVPVPVPVLRESVDSYKNGDWEIQVGEQVQVLHFSSGRWVLAEVKAIRLDESGRPDFSFYISPPGWVTVRSDRIKKAKKAKRRRKNVIED